MENIYGIPCNINDKRIRTLIAQVLERVQNLCPSDWKKIKRWVLGFDWFDEDDPKFTDEMLAACVWTGGSPVIPSWIYFSHKTINFDDMCIIAIISHELGHAVTSRVDLRSREIDNHPVYAELCASRYVFKWGFVREYVAFLQIVNSDQHYGGLPGDIFVIKLPDRKLQYRIGLDFKPIFIRAVDENGQVLETPPIYKISP